MICVENELQQTPFDFGCSSDSSFSTTNQAEAGIMSRPIGYKHSGETKRKIGLANKGKKMSQEFRDKCRQRQLGKKLSEETKRKMSLAKLGNGRLKHGEGYIMVYKPDHPFARKNGYIMEHRLVMEKKIGRYLKPKEIPHHINGIKEDNRPENLELFENLSKHMSYHRGKN